MRVKLPTFRTILLVSNAAFALLQATTIGWNLYYNLPSKWYNTMFIWCMFTGTAVLATLNYFEPRIRAEAAADALSNASMGKTKKKRRVVVVMNEDELRWELPKL